MASGNKATIAARRAARKMERREKMFAAARQMVTGGLKPGTHTRNGIVQRDGILAKAAY
jgi:hypothetical protein